MLIKPKSRQARVSDENRKRIMEFFRENPDAPLTDAQRKLDMAYATIWKHVKAINEGWRPKE